MTANLTQLKEALKLARTRLQICENRFRGCHEAFQNNEELAGHGVSLAEIPAWRKDIDDALAEVPSE